MPYGIEDRFADLLLTCVMLSEMKEEIFSGNWVFSQLKNRKHGICVVSISICTGQMVPSCYPNE